MTLGDLPALIGVGLVAFGFGGIVGVTRSRAAPTFQISQLTLGPNDILVFKVLGWDVVDPIERELYSVFGFGNPKRWLFVRKDDVDLAVVKVSVRPPD